MLINQRLIETTAVVSSAAAAIVHGGGRIQEWRLHFGWLLVVRIEITDQRLPRLVALRLVELTVVGMIEVVEWAGRWLLIHWRTTSEAAISEVIVIPKIVVISEVVVTIISKVI